MDLGIYTVLRFVALQPAFILHELAHAWTANRCGDDTARRAGRLTLNPVSLLLGILDLLPIAPLDGAAVLEAA